MNKIYRLAASPRSAQMGSKAMMINLALAALMIAQILFLMPHPARADTSDTAAGSVKAATGVPVRIIALGDSLTAGYGLKPGQAFPDVLQLALRSRGHAVEVVNAGISGDTTAAGLARLDWAVGDDADAVIVELGANDALRGQPPAETRANLDQILTRLAKRGLPVLLAGMRSPENWGNAYRDAFDAIYRDLAAKHSALLYPFFLEGIATDPKLNLADGLHPNARGIALIVERILPSVEALLARVSKKHAAASSAGK